MSESTAGWTKWARIAAYSLLGFALFRWFSGGSSGPEEDTPARAFTLPLATHPSNTVSLDSFRGDPLVIEVFASWCGACRDMAPRMAELAQATRTRPVRFLGVAVDTPKAEALAAHNAWKLPFDVAIGDATFSNDYRIRSLPTLIVIDERGQIRQVTTGVTSTSRIDGWLADLGAGRR
ncbi:MAG: TlpA disulfide reductase family protein [Polyangiaceae bacterium]